MKKYLKGIALCYVNSMTIIFLLLLGDCDVSPAPAGARHSARQLLAGRRGGVLRPAPPPTQLHRGQGLLLDTGVPTKL